jgi:hypothetical protein
LFSSKEKENYDNASKLKYFPSNPVSEILLPKCKRPKTTLEKEIRRGGKLPADYRRRMFEM